MTKSNMLSEMRLFWGAGRVLKIVCFHLLMQMMPKQFEVFILHVAIIS